MENTRLFTEIKFAEKNITIYFYQGNLLKFMGNQKTHRYIAGKFLYSLIYQCFLQLLSNFSLILAISFIPSHLDGK